MSWTAPAMFDALKAELEDWEPLSGVEIYTAPPVKPPTSGDAIVLLRAPGEQDWRVLGNQSRDDKYRIECFLLSIANGLGEDAAVTARTRAGELIGAVADCLSDISASRLSALATTIGANQVFPFHLSNISLDLQGAESARRACAVDFDIQVHATVS